MEKKLDSSTDDIKVEIPAGAHDCKINSIPGNIIIDHHQLDVHDLQHDDHHPGSSKAPTLTASGSPPVEMVLETTQEVASPPAVTPDIMASPAGKANDDDDDGHYYPRRKKPKKLEVLFIIEFSLFVCITLVLILSITMNKLLVDKEIWSLELWKWCGLGLACCCGRLFSEWLMNILVFLIEKKFLRRSNVGYFIHTAQKSFQVFIWLGLILLTWVLLINRGVSRRSSHTSNVVLIYITRGIGSTLVVAGAWILRTIAVNFLYASFYEKRFFDRIQENLFHQSILQALGKPLLMDQLSKDDGIIDVVQKLPRIQRGRVSAWTMSRLIEIASRTGFLTLDTREDMMNSVEQENDRDITNEFEAMAAAYFLFRNVAKPGYNYIEEEDLLRFMNREDVDMVLPMIGEEEIGKVNRKSVTNWVVSLYMKGKYLEHSLNDIKEAIKELNKFVTGLLVVVLIILWVILMGIVKTEVLLFISSQFLLAVFTFGSSAKSTFEAMIFVFVKHPFDVGDRCVIDGVQVVVEEVSILTTVFLRYDNEKMYYPNSILATKCISNFNRSPDMRDTVEFDLDISTSAENISALKAKIKTYIDSKDFIWQPPHSFQVMEIEDANKIKMRLYVTHTINFQNYEEKSNRRSNLVLELKNIFQQLGIKYHILPPTHAN
uniref:mechanosensitive ion channel protein 10-like n=1 Tax=Erigeron canadensis TaxID=72917 RepID=UPI001CB95365|nr:mechanosensitive ion channel protein 10-like [Erigeron canadensis]